MLAVLIAGGLIGWLWATWDTDAMAYPIVGLFLFVMTMVVLLI